MGHPRRYSATPSKPPRPGASTLRAWSPMLSSIYVLPPVVSFLAYDLPSGAVSLHAAPNGGFPPATSARVAPASRFRAREPTTARPLRRTQRHGSSRPGSLRRSSVKSRRQSRRGTEAMPDPPSSDPAPNLVPPHPARFPSRDRKRSADSLFRSAVEILPTRFKVFSLLRRCDPP